MPKEKKQTLLKENLAESLIKSQPGLFVLFDKEGFIHWWNNRLEYYSGYTAEQIEDMKILDLVDEQDKRSVQEKIDEAFRSGMGEIEIQLRNMKGKPIHCLFTWVAVDMDGDDYIIGTGIDITKLQQERLDKMRYHQVLEKSKNEIIMFDPETHDIVYANEGARQNLGYSKEEINQMKIYDFKPEYDEETYSQHLQLLLTSDRDSYKYETIHKRSDGSQYDAEVNLQLVKSDDYTVFVSIVLDITERRKRENLIKASLREKELLLGEVHHRVKNNLAIISSLINLQAGNSKTDSVKNILQESDSRIKTMAMIHQMLYEQENFSELKFDIYLKRLTRYIAGNFQDNQNNIETRVKADGIRIDIISAVPCALIIHELVTNSFKHACRGKDTCTIEVKLSLNDNTFTLVVSDNGIGLPDSFDVMKANSLGMTLVRGLTHQLGGKLDVQGKDGTTFTVTFDKSDEPGGI